jgi:hypothetical protein
VFGVRADTDDQAAFFGIVTLCCNVNSSNVSLGIFTWSTSLSQNTPALQVASRKFWRMPYQAGQCSNRYDTL